MNRLPFILLILFPSFHLAACDDSEREWDTGRAALGGVAADQEEANEHWDTYRDEIVRGLDLMRDALSVAPEEGTVADHAEIDRLARRVGSLREDMASRIDAPSQSEQLRLRSEFESVRTDVDALLMRLDYDPDMIARWQDET